MADRSVKLETERLLVRRFALLDSPFILRLLNDHSFILNIRDSGVRDFQDAETYLKNGPLKSYETHDFGLNLVSLKDGTPIGMCGLIKRDTLPDVDLGFAFLTEHQGRGYATEVALATLKQGYETHNLKRIIAITSQTNTASKNVLEKIGFRFENHIKLPHAEEELNLYGIHRPY